MCDAPTAPDNKSLPYAKGKEKGESGEHEHGQTSSLLLKVTNLPSKKMVFTFGEFIVIYLGF